MKFALNVPNCGNGDDYADPGVIAEVAHEAEVAGWDGFFTWDHIGDKWAEEVHEPWILLTAAAMRTQRIKLGTLVTPIPRRRPWKLAREIVTLDHLSAGRVILGVGTGVSIEYSSYHEPSDNHIHGEMLDEGLEVLTLLQSGKYIDYEGKHYQLSHVRHLPRPVQQPHIPIWVGGVWPNKKPMQRAAHWDGAFPIGKRLSLLEQMSPEEEEACLHFIRAQQIPERATQPFDMVHWCILSGKDRTADVALVELYAAVGVTWWVEKLFPERGTLQHLRTYIRQGPPKL